MWLGKGVCDGYHSVLAGLLLMAAKVLVLPPSEFSGEPDSWVGGRVVLRNVRLHEFLQWDRARHSHSILLSNRLLLFRILLGDPEHSFARCGLAKTEMRLTRDGYAYTFRELEEEHGELATWYWERSTVLNPVSKSKYHGFRELEKQACHRALLCILRKQNDILIGRKVLTSPRTVRVLPGQVRQLIASFISIDKEAMKAMTYMKRTLLLKDKSHGEGNVSVSILLHKRWVNDKQAAGEEPVCVCSDCFDAFPLKAPKMCKYALANDLWLGRWDPLFRKANLTYQMLLALVRMVATKVVLRPEGNAISNAPNASFCDFLFHQSGMIGSAVVFPNGEGKTVMESFPPKNLRHSFAVSFVTCDSELAADVEASTVKAKVVVSKIAKLMVDRSEFDEQAAMLQDMNCVYREAVYDKQLVAFWVPDPDKSIVPPTILDRVVAVPCQGNPGTVVASGPADVTAAGEADRADADLEAESIRERCWRTL